MKNILVFMDGSSPQAVLDTAFRLGRAFGARIECHSFPPSMMNFVSPEAAPALCDSFVEQAEQIRNLHKAAFRACADEFLSEDALESSNGLTARLVEDRDADLEAVVAHARMFDLVVVPAPDADVDVPPRHLEAYMLPSIGCPSLIVPEHVRRDFASRIYLVWSNNHHGSRVLSSTMPLLKQAREVIVSGFGNTSLEDVDTLVDCLQRHNVSAKRCAATLIDSVADLQQAFQRVKFDLLLVSRSTCQSYSDRILNRTPKCILNSVGVPILIVY